MKILKIQLGIVLWMHAINFKAAHQVSGCFVPTVVLLPHAVNLYSSLSWFIPKALIHSHTYWRHMTYQLENLTPCGFLTKTLK